MDEGLTSAEKQLHERLKELQYLYHLSSIIETGVDPGTVLQEAAGHAHKALQFPDKAFCCIRFDDAEYHTERCPKKAINRQISADIKVGGAVRGAVTLGYADDIEFLPVEKLLPAEIARMLSSALERRKAEEELKCYIDSLEEQLAKRTTEVALTRKHFEDLVMYAPDAVVISRDNGDIVKANPSFYRMLQYPEDGSLSLNFVKDKLYQDIPRVRPHVYSELDRQGFLEGYEINLLDRSGDPVPVIASFIYIDIGGERCVESIFKDIRYRKEIERRLIERNENLEELVRQRTADLEKRKNQLISKNRELVRLTHECRESRERLQTLFNAITDTVVMLDGDYNILMSNKPAVKPGGKCHGEVFALDAPCVNCPGATALGNGTPAACEQRLGEEYFHMRAYPVFSDSGEITGVIEFAREITSEKNLELQLMQTDKLASLGQLVSGVAHEINNPNTFIRGNISIIEEALNDILPLLDAHAAGDPDFRVARLRYDVFRDNIMVLVRDMHQGSDRIKSIVDGLREFARKDDGVLDDDIDVNAVIESCLRLVQNQIKRTARVSFEAAAGLPRVKGNFQKLEQVLVNMLINASHAVDKDKGVITVSTRHDARRREVQILVGDNGTGMDENTLKHIFDPFFTTKRSKGGTGLGLSIAHRIIREHKGGIEVESRAGHGTTFFIHLPAAEDSAK